MMIDLLTIVDIRTSEGNWCVLRNNVYRLKYWPSPRALLVKNTATSKNRHQKTYRKQVMILIIIELRKQSRMKKFREEGRER